MTLFTHLHVHSNYSFCLGANSIEEICKTAKQQGMDSLAITDTNGIYGLVWFIMAAKEIGLKPIIGAEVKADKIKCVVLAKNLNGYATLCKILTARHCDENFDLAQFLSQNHDDVVILSASTDFLAKLLKVNCDIYAEIIPHNNGEEVLKFSRHTGIPPVASCDAYFIHTGRHRGTAPTSGIISISSVILLMSNAVPALS